jgi:hypothetical protein
MSLLFSKTTLGVKETLATAIGRKIRRTVEAGGSTSASPLRDMDADIHRCLGMCRYQDHTIGTVACSRPLHPLGQIRMRSSRSLDSHMGRPHNSTAQHSKAQRATRA